LSRERYELRNTDVLSLARPSFAPWSGIMHAKNFSTEVHKLPMRDRWHARIRLRNQDQAESVVPVRVMVIAGL